MDNFSLIDFQSTLPTFTIIWEIYKNKQSDGRNWNHMISKNKKKIKKIKTFRVAICYCWCPWDNFQGQDKGRLTRQWLHVLLAWLPFYGYIIYKTCCTGVESATWCETHASTTWCIASILQTSITDTVWCLAAPSLYMFVCYKYSKVMLNI